MSNKEWHEEIPNQGVLCKELSSGSVVRIISKSANKRLNAFVIDDCLIPNSFATTELVPLTSREWWDFAPWQPIETAPISKWVMAMDKDGNVRQHIFHWEYVKLKGDYTKWLPLPKANHE